MTSALALVTGIGLSLAGCTQSPLAPSDPSGGATPSFTSPPIASFAADGSLSYVPVTVGAEPGASVMKAATLSRAVSSSVYIDGSRGGAVRAGRFGVWLPAGAFAGSATVTLSMADSTVMVCDISISPQSANKFKYPAELIADLSSVNVSMLTMYWYDPARVQWVNLAARSRIAGFKVMTALDHFSTYAAGKAGW